MTFDLVVASVDRVAPLQRLFSSLARQTHKDFRVLLVDQNDDDRLAEAVRDHPSLRIEHLHSPRGLARARNTALSRLAADVIAWPDDDCEYARDLLERVAQRFSRDPSLDGVTGRADDSPRWKEEPATLTRENLWNRAISFTIFLRHEVVEHVGEFDERLGLPASSGEETEYLIRALDGGARIEYDPTLVVQHARKDVDLPALGAREGASIGYILRKHRYPARTVARMFVRPAVGIVLEPRRAGFHLATLRGRVRGYRS
jgi:glycosyltransferase involved in cell wall biosynthesis